MNKNDIILILAFSIVISPLLLGLQFDNFGTSVTTGTVVKTHYSTFPFSQTEVTFIYTAPNGTILEETYTINYEGRLNLELNTPYKITATKHLLHLYATVEEIERLSS